jgi:Zn-dependent protease with chaperone function/Zn-finger nucleic acid-binding protein
MARDARDFYEIQERQRRKSLLVFAALILFDFFAMGLVSAAVVLSVGMFIVDRSIWTGSFILRLLLFDFLASALIAWFHFQDARRFGAQYILKRLEAGPPDPNDRYHRQFLNTLDEMRIAAGMPRVEGFILPTSAINSMALVQSDGTPAVAVTEGLLAECTRDEIQAVAGHELAHIARGDAFYVTLVCSLSNFFEKMREALEPEPAERPPGAAASRSSGKGGPVLVYLAVALSSLVMRLLSMLISREREILADAAAVEFGRDPAALGRAIYKAAIKNSFVCDFSFSYSPLFIVSPVAEEEGEGFFARLFSSHPPLMKRLDALAAMAHKTSKEIIAEVWENREARKGARTVLESFEEARAGRMTPREETSAAAAIVAEVPQDSRVWSVRNPRGAWDGPMSVAEMISLPYFSSMIQVRNIQEGITAKAREFPQVRLALRRAGGRQPLDPAVAGKCPRCRVPLSETFYEGVPVRVCPKCLGKLVDASLMDRIIARREVAFSGDLVAKAMAFKDRFLSQPVQTKKLSEAGTGKPLPCPECGYLMRARPYSYSYFVPVDKCLSCHKIWFDADELEILQILIESR